MFSGVYKHATTETAWLSINGFARLVSGNSFDPTNLTRGKLTGFVQVPMATLKTHPGVARVVMGGLLKAIYLAGGAMDGRVLLLIDEARFLGRLEAMTDVYDAYRKYGITMITMWPSLGKIKEIWGDAGVATFLASSSWVSYSGIGDRETAEYVSAMLGDHGVLAYSEGTSDSRNAGLGGADGGRSFGRNWSVHEHARRLMKPEEVRAMPPDEAIVIARGSTPARCGKAIYFKRPDMAGKFEADRFHSASIRPARSER